MGTIMAGCIFVPGQPGHGDRDMERLLSAAKPSVILTQRVHADALLRAAKTNSPLALAQHSIFIFDDDILDSTGEPYLGFPHWQDMVGSPAENNWEYPDIQSSQDYHSTIVIMFTSGTTGNPKGVEISHCNYISAAISYMQRVSLHPDWQKSAQNTNDASPIRVLGTLGMHHILGQRSYSVIFPKLGVPLYLLRLPSSQNILDAVERFNITDAIVRSSMLTEIAKTPHRKSLMSRLSSLKRVEGCAAPMPQSTKTILEALGIDRVSRVWGLTELGLITGHDMNTSSTPQSVGELHANYEGKVTNSSNPSQTVDRSTIGDIWIRAPSRSVGYYQNAEATLDAHGVDGWFSTGDVGYVDERGQWYIVDRKKDLIKVNGNHVAPTELEDVLLQHPDIAGVGIIGVAVNQDEGPRAYIQTADHSSLSSTEIHRFMVDKVAPYKYLSGGVSFIPRIPRNSNGKILRAELRELAKKELGGFKGHYHGVFAYSAEDSH
ncbi:4-coumarate-CoA ligase 1 [Penicillium cinerascens]|uniref:4-coumarate-CoA ligase 1 n=1 Tax=Penicillium cinerascens TaxID=70096 RepID=A0A9W9MLL6_9EURO|nr:4-coumarate-CoA ligase 1 [Penicillium cinerascens]KAJ5203618.1 4-coumarate-CoA ligase 1 [Penicillium cinerascens]